MAPRRLPIADSGGYIVVSQSVPRHFDFVLLLNESTSLRQSQVPLLIQGVWMSNFSPLFFIKFHLKVKLRSACKTEECEDTYRLGR